MKEEMPLPPPSAAELVFTEPTVESHYSMPWTTLVLLPLILSA